jgi:GNAT superfamily N-acetyltransferase
MCAQRLRRRGARFGRDYRERLKLANGTIVRFRLLQREDSPLLVQIFDKLSPEARYQRFFAHKSALSAADLRALTDCDGANHVGIVAVAESDDVEEGVGVTRFVRLRDDPLTAEVAVTVVDAYQRQGIGRMLLRRLFEAAAERGIQRLQHIMLADNLPMKALVRQFAPEARHGSRRWLGAAVSTFVVALPVQRGE